VTHNIRWQILLILLGIVLVGVLLTYLAVNYTTEVLPGRGGTYVEGVAGFPQFLNPLLSPYSDTDRDLCSLLYSGLTRLGENGELIGDLARDWDVTIDGLQYTFRLRSNAYWHDGMPVTAGDVIFTFSLLQDPDFPAHPELGQAVWQAASIEWQDVHTVRIKLQEPYAPFLHYTTIGILPAHLLADVDPADLASHPFNLSPIGSGPFRLEEIEVEDGLVTSAVLQRHEDYHRTRPFIERIQFRFYASREEVLAAYAEGRIEGIGGLTPQELEAARAYPTLRLYSAPIAETAMVLLNLADDDLPFFQEAEVRQALLYALDRQQVIDEQLGGQAIVAHSPLMPGSWAYNEDVTQYEPDPELAGSLLDEAGWRRPLSGDRTRRKGDQQVSFTLLTWDEPQRIAVAAALADQWFSIGVSVTIEPLPAAQLHEALEDRDFDAVLIHVPTPGDPDPYALWHETQVDTGQNYSGLQHRRISEVIEQARVVSNAERRKGLYYEFQELFAQEMPALLLYVPAYTYGVDERIHDVQLGPLMSPSDRFQTIASWWIVPRRVLVGDGS
jgi:peptide/nickel transport system substrate-binding protein